MVRRRRIKEVVDTKVIVGENVEKQHRIVVSVIIIRMKWKKAPQPVKRIKCKAEYLNAGAVDDGEVLKMQGEKVKRAKNFKSLGSIVSSDRR